MSNRQNQIPRRGHAKGMSRRKFVGTAAGATAAGGIAIGFPNIALGATSIRTIGLGVSIMNELQGRATKDLGAKIRGQALGYGALFGKMLNQNDQYEVCEHNFAELELFVPSKVWQPIDTHRVKNWDKVTDLCKTGRLTPGSQLGQGDAPYRHLWLDKDGNFTKGPSRYISMVPVWHNADSIGYNPEITKRKIDSWADLLSPEFKGQGALINVPQIGTMDAALAVEAMGLITFKDKGNMSRQEIDFLIDVLIKKKKQGHFRAFWENFGQSVNLMVSGEVAVQSMWSPAVSAVQAEGVPCVYAFPKEGMRGWHGGMAISAKTSGKKLDAAYDYINWWLDGWAGAFVARQGYYMSTPETTRKNLDPAEWDYWYDGKPAAKDLSDPFGNLIVTKGDVRDGGSYWTRFKKIAVWNSLMDENQYLVKRWTEFLSA